MYIAKRKDFPHGGGKKKRVLVLHNNDMWATTTPRHQDGAHAHTCQHTTTHTTHKRTNHHQNESQKRRRGTYVWVGIILLYVII